MQTEQKPDEYSRKLNHTEHNNTFQPYSPWQNLQKEECEHYINLIF